MGIPVRAIPLSPGQLSPDLIGRWESLRAKSTDLVSPFFAPEFTRTVARHRGDVEVGVMENAAGNAIGFLPFQRRGRTAFPVGNRLNDFHGAILSPDGEIDEQRLWLDLRLDEWRFHHQVSGRFPSAGWGRQLRSPLIRLNQSFDVYMDGRRHKHARTFKDQRRRWGQLESRALEMGLGPLRFEFEANDVAMMDRLFAWKSAQYARTGQPDVFAFSWIKALMHDLSSQRNPAFGGILSVLYAGQRPIAMHFGIRSNQCFHCWFPAYDTEFARWSPGLQLWVKLIEAAATSGFQRIDFGSGPEPFKYKLANSETSVSEGMATSNRLKQFYHQACYQAANWLRRSPLKAPLRRVASVFRSTWRQREFR